MTDSRDRRQRMTGRLLFATVALALVAGFAYWVWPTPYRYLPSPRKEILAVRVNRFTGEADYLLYSGWLHAHR